MTSNVSFQQYSVVRTLSERQF